MIRQKAKSVISKAFGSGIVSRDGINVAVSCPECDPNKSKKKLSVRLDDYRFHCWVCGHKGKNVWKYISKRFPEVHIDEKLFARKLSIENPDSPEEKIVTLPKDFVPVFRKSLDPDVKAVKNYLIKRGLTESDILKWRILTTKKGSFRRRVIVPSFNIDGDLNYFVGRTIDQGPIKYLNAKVPKREIVFNEIDIDWNRTVVLVEGVFDAIKSISNTIPLLGSTLSRDSLLYRSLMKAQADVIVSLDPDLKEKALKISKSLLHAGCRVRICFAKEGVDMGDSSKIENKKMLDTAQEFTPYSHLSFKIGSIRSGSII